ncbi:DUF2167 domain-containing protein (plasmid) [Methylobacterium sp. NMS12]
MKAGWADAAKVATAGPAKVGLRDQADLAIPTGQVFVPQPQAGRIMRAYGNLVSPNLIGLVAGTGDGEDWLVVVRFVADGYIKDDDARDWNADDLLQSLKDGTEEANTDRAKRGFPAIEVLGWVEKPAYDAHDHRLVWSLATKSVDQPIESDRGVNYNTYALGRDGYFSLDLLTTAATVEAQKPVAQTLLAGLTYRPGKAYADFNASTDRIAAYGLAALVGGVAIKKLGLFALAAAFVLKFAKIGLLAVVGLWAAFMKLFRRKPKQVQAAPEVTTRDGA